MRGFRWPPASGAGLGPTPPCRATRRQGNADLWSAQPAAGGRQGRTPSCGRLGRARRHRRRFRAPARADRRSAFPCLRPALPVWRPPPGDLAAFPRRRRREGRKDVWVSHPFGARCRSETGAPLSRAVCVSGYARVSLASGQRCRSRPHATMQSDAQARERRPLVGTARRRRAAGKDPELAGMVRLSAGPGVIGAGFALPRVPGPTGRTAQRSAFPCLRPALPVWRPPPGDLAAFLCYGRFVEAVRCRAREKNWQRTSFAAVDFGGKCERGLPPFTINNDKSELAAARLRRARKFRFPARSAGRFLDGAPSQSSLSEPF